MTSPPDPATSEINTGSTPTAAIVLAAGAGARFAGKTHKLNASWGNNTIAGASIGIAVQAAIGPVIVVTGATQLTAPVPSARVVHNPAWAEGQSTSLQVGVATARGLGCDAVVIGLADQPFITAAAWRAVAASDSPIAVATYDNQRRNPVRLHESVWHLLPTTGDEGARTIIRLHSELVTGVSCEGSPVDIDTWEDYQQWQSKSSTNLP